MLMPRSATAQETFLAVEIFAGGIAGEFFLFHPFAHDIAEYAVMLAVILLLSGGHYSSRWLERQQRIFDNCQHDSIRGVPEHSQRPPEAAKSFRYSSGKPPSTKERLRAQLAAKCTNTAWRTSASLLPEF